MHKYPAAAAGCSAVFALNDVKLGRTNIMLNQNLESTTILDKKKLNFQIRVILKGELGFYGRRLGFSVCFSYITSVVVSSRHCEITAELR